jgi:uroporphyrinogen-III synthase
MRLLVTRPEPDASELASLLSAMGHEPVVEPMLRIEYLEHEEIALDNIIGLAATSRNALRALARRPQTLAAVLDVPIYVVGPGSLALARQLGFARVQSADRDSAALAALIASQSGDQRGAILLLGGVDRAGDLDGLLQAAGVTSRRVILYRMAAAERFSAETLYLLRNDRIGGVLLMSPRTAEIYLGLVEQAGLRAIAASMQYFCLSKAVASPIEREGFERISVACRPNTQELLALVEGVAAQSAQKS